MENDKLLDKLESGEDITYDDVINNDGDGLERVNEGYTREYFSYELCEKQENNKEKE